MFVSLLAALIGFLLTGFQALLIYYQGEGLCFNDGCRVIDSLTTVDPLIFNLAGFSFFLLVLIGISRARKGSDLWMRFVSLLLLAGLAAEGVLLAFQLLVSQLFCSYCLIILGLVVVANAFLGLKQLFKSIFILGAVLLASFSLDYRSVTTGMVPLESGTMARRQPTDATHQLYLFFSSSCSHCETVLQSLQSSTACAINFNPIEPITSFSFPEATATGGYRHEVNLRFLKTVGIEKIPVLLDKTDSTMTLVHGEQAISQFIEQNCFLPDSSMTGQSAGSTMTGGQSTNLPLPKPTEDGCSITEECQESSPQSSKTSAY